MISDPLRKHPLQTIILHFLSSIIFLISIWNTALVRTQKRDETKLGTEDITTWFSF